MSAKSSKRGTQKPPRIGAQRKVEKPEVTTPDIKQFNAQKPVSYSVTENVPLYQEGSGDISVTPVRQSLKHMVDTPELKSHVTHVETVPLEEPAPSVLEMIKKRVTLYDVTPDMWKDVDLDLIWQFVEDPAVHVLIIYKDPLSGIVLEHYIRTALNAKQLCYFIKKPRTKEVTSDNFLKVIQYGSVKGPSYLESLLRLLSGVFAPLFFENTTWPDSIKNDFSAQLHKFLATLTDTHWKLEDKTVLYIPKECLNIPIEIAAKHKEFVQRLETSMIHWARQIKEVLSTQHSIESSETTGPLDEIEFWKNRCADLSGISSQLDNKVVRRITQILELAKSSYVNPFIKLSSQIKEGSYQAESNLRFLMILKEPCLQLSEAMPKDIPFIISKLLTLIRIIWINSEFYNTKEKLTGLLKKLSNEIIHQCCKAINLDRIFDGYIISSSQILTDCIECCEKWREKYDMTSALHNRFAAKGWVLDLTSIFAQIDAFMQRCKDLLEVCDTQVHFARMEEGKQIEMPHFAGQRGPDITRGILEIERAHQKYLSQLRSTQKTILDIKSTSWHDDFNKFRSGIKDLEVMLQTLINTAFETLTSVSEGIEMLDIFMQLCNRENIRRTIDKKTRSTFNIFSEEMNTVKKELTLKSPNILKTHPKYSGSACWIKCLKTRIDINMKVIEKAYFLNQANFFDIMRNYQQLTAALDENIRKYFNEWNLSLEKDPLTYLDLPLMQKTMEDDAPVLHLNFNKSLLKMLSEIHYWEYLMFEIPYYAARVYSKHKDLRERREHVLLVVRDYNRIINSLNQNERGLFKERIKFLDKKILPGLTKLTWNSKGTTDAFITDCRNCAQKIQQRIDYFKTDNLRIAMSCVQVSEMLMADIDSRKIYEDLEFGTLQKQHQLRIIAKLIDIHGEILNIIDKQFDTFKLDGPEVYQHWFIHINNLDKMIEEAFRLNIKYSLQTLNKAINIDTKAAPNPLFSVEVVLRHDTIQFSPSIEQLFDMVYNVGHDMISSISIIPRLIEKYPKEGIAKMAICDEISVDDEIQKIEKLITHGMNSNAAKLWNYRQTWEEEKVLWEIDKASFIMRYKKSKPSVSKFDGDIGRYTEKANNIQSKETVINIDFVVLNCTPLKAAIQGHCHEWQNKLTGLLLELATTELTTLDSYIKENSKLVCMAPQTLPELKKSLKLWDELNSEQAKVEARFQPLLEQFAILSKYEVRITEESTIMLHELKDQWNSFKQTLETSDCLLKKSKEQFKSSLMNQSEGFKKQVTHLLEEFQQKGPFSCENCCDSAIETLSGFRENVALLKSQEQVLRSGLSMFKVDLPPSKEIMLLEKELELIETIWIVARDWETNWNLWKGSKFTDIQTEEIETFSLNVSRKLNKLSRDLKDRHWSILDSCKTKVDTFKRTMPLIQDLKNPAMRPRHWEQISSEIQRHFDYTSQDFTLERIIELGFDQYAEYINSVSGAAKKELFIEQSLEGIKNTWEITDIDMASFKALYKIKGTDEVFASLDDNQVLLSTMKASRFVKAFEQEVDYWERTLSHILEVMELLLTVQRQWMYLENIFLGEDIRKQLPRESEDFDDVNTKWKIIMIRINKEKNALRASHHPGLYDQLNAMNVKLENIQKSLDMYLETKRQIFPRFYFLSNDDLLEILGQARNPEAVQPHLKKCFDNIKSLAIIRPSTQRFEAVAMNSCEGECVEFKPQGTIIEGPVEAWLIDIEKTMKYTLKEVLITTRNALKKQLNKRDKWIKEYCGQMTIVASQIQWTGDMTKALMKVKERGDKKALKLMKKKQVVMLNKYSELARKPDKGYQRMKLVSLITIEVHNRDIIEKLIKSGCNDANAFEWISQLRLYWDKELNDCIVRQTNTQFLYGYEYLGNSGRLVITPLTDRCYMTLTTALHLHRGGSPKGPAGTGKTETTKDLGKALGNYVIVVNCSEGLDYKSMGRMFSGLAQTGAWGCFDEFNRINIEVLSVVAQQILSILTALHSGAMQFLFEGREINLVWSCGIFITMNPGYAGRTELPDNLKSMFRPIAMVVPDSNMIAEIILFGEGFSNTKHLAKKVYTLYNLATQQLSKQDHYDFGLRALVSVLRYAGKKKRKPQSLTDEEILLLSLKDMNIAKLTSVDLPLFNGIMSDLFPGVEPPIMEDVKFKANIKSELLENNLLPNAHTIIKVVQLGETKDSRHSTMIVGRTQSGKTVAWKILQAAKNRDSPQLQVKEYPLNPKALSLGELYGEFDLSSNEWSDGVLSSIMRQICADEKKDEKWIIFDGPVDTLWIESMNSVMDDNKVLTLINGERIGMPEQVSMLFEVEDLAVASPATVSRCGMVYTDYQDLGWEPYIECWLNIKKNKELVEEIRRLILKYLVKMLTFKRENCRELIPTAELNGVISLCKLFDCFATAENGVDFLTDPDNFGKIVELWFQFCMIWSICCSVDEDGRKKIDTYIREMEGTFPTKDTIYEYYVDSKNKSWVHWEEKLKKGWRYNPSIPFYKLVVPTVDTVRYQYLVSQLIYSMIPVLLVGPVGTGKTSVAGNALSLLDTKVYNILTVYMSAQTSSNNIQDIIESRVEKRTKGVYVPVGGKKLITFLDDFNMPAKDLFGSQPPLELIRLWLDYAFWYDRSKQTPKHIKDMLLVAAMGPPGGGRMVISKRLQSRFNLINMTFPTDSEVIRIFGSMINQKLQDFDEEVKPIGDVVTRSTVEIYTAVVNKFLPTPTKIHYLFNLRDISRVFQGMLRAHKDYHDTKVAITRLWIHECFRVFSDRLINPKDHESFVCIISEKLGNLFDQTYHNICPNKQPPIFGDYLNPDLVYEDIQDMGLLKKQVQEMLMEYNNTPGVVPMDLVLFRDAIEHISKIVRVIRQARGNMLLVGIGGSGRQSLTRLASSICEYSLFAIEVTKHYRRMEFREDIKKLYTAVGVEGKPTVFLFNDTQVAEESFLEDLNNVLSSGEVPNLYKPDEYEEVRNALSELAKKEGIDDTPQSIFAFLIDRVRTNLHVVMCMSPVGEPFRNRIRMYPAFVNCTTIDWFSQWPQDALLEVADKYLIDMKTENEEEEKLKHNIAKMFSLIHKSVHDYSDRMTAELKRHNYVTPTNYLELVSGYKVLLQEKKKDLGDAANKLKNGLSKIDETRVKVQKMSAELDEDKIKVAQVQQQCDEYLSVLFQQKKEADDQQKFVAQKSERISEEEIKCKHMANLAQQDLSEALPALEEAMLALEALNKKDIGEIKSYGRPPALVEKVMEAVMILKGNEPNWAEAKRQLGDPNFIKSLVNFDKDNISDRVLNKIGKYVSQADFTPDIIGRVSGAAKSLCMWVRAMEVYGRIYRVVEPKKLKLNTALSQLKEKQDALADAKAKLAEVEANMTALRNQYDERIAQKEELRLKAERTEMMLERAHKLVSGLAGEKVRWEETVTNLEESMGFLIGDCLLAAAFLSYMGPFLSNYREELLYKHWLKHLRTLGIPCDPCFNFCSFLVRPTLVRQWNIQGLPSDSFSTENGIIVSKGNRWPLMIDPQGQAIKWIKRMEGKNGLKIIDLQQSDFMRTLERAIQFGFPVLLQNVQDTLDPSLDPILFKAVIKIGDVSLIKLGDKEIEYNSNFRFYITTKLSNPHYTPEISTKTTIVNFAVKEQGLVGQLLGIVVRKERTELEEQKDSLVQSIAANKKKLEDCEDEILRLLNETKGSLLEDETLVNTLQTSKSTSQEVTEQLATSEQTEAKIDSAREGYSPCAERASILFFVLNDLGVIDPMYQFSLDSYIDLFTLSIEKSHRSTKLEERIQNLNDYHTYAMYRYACRGLFGKHKLLFSFQMCVKILEAASKINMDEYNFFLRGGVVLDRENQMDNPCSGWLYDTAWDNITELDKLTNFHGIITSFEQYSRDWHSWYISSEPEQASLPSDWDNACNELQRMLIVRSLRPDRVSFCSTTFIINNLGSKFVEPPVLDTNQVLTESSKRTPLIFVLSPGVDPSNYLIQLAETKGMGARFHALSLGQGQAPIATRMLQEGVREGNWIFLANCHLSLSWMPQLDKLVEQLQTDIVTHNDFRLWLSSSPHPEFPISILQAGIKMTTEPPKGLKANMKRLYGQIEKKKSDYCTKHEKYKKLLFSLCYFHSVLLERRKFLMLGWNIPYEFNDSDFEVSENLMSIYLQDYEETPWDALKYLIAGINYGGHVTDDYDRRLLFTYINDYFCEQAITQPFFKLSSLNTYYIPKDGPISSYIEYVSMLPNMDHPEAFGQHPNADITSQIQETRLLFDVLLSLQPQISSYVRESRREDKVLDLAANIYQQIPEDIDYETTRLILSVEMSPLSVVLLQEIQRYNELLEQMRLSLKALEKGIQGLVVMTFELEMIFNCIFDGRVPPSWEKAYPSLKPLAAWTRDLVLRIEQLHKWAQTAHAPTIFWLSGFTFPTGFLTAVLQTSARQNNISVDMLSWEFTVMTVGDSNITGPPKDGVYVKGLYLQGAGWDKRNACLIEALPIQLVCPMPTIHFKPVENKKKNLKGIYTCPCYYYPNRAGTSDRTSFIVPIDVKAGESSADHWTKRGTALLMSLDY